MVSKSILVALSIVALTCNAASTVVPSSGGSNVVELNPCIVSIVTIDVGLGLNMGTDRLLAQILNVALNLIRAILHLAGGLLATVFNLVTGLLGNLFHGNKPSVPAPQDLSKLLAVLHVGCLTLDKGMGAYIGDDIYSENYVANILKYVIIQIALNGGININGPTWSWCQLDSTFNIHTCLKELSDILDLDQVRLDVNLTGIVTSLRLLIATVLNSLDNILGSTLGLLASIIYNVIAGFSYQCGYKNYQQVHDCVIKAYNPVLQSHKCGSINVSILTGGSYCSNNCMVQ